ncbi:hypothetical protein PMG11_09656 [Penicillium brasilianum]|uniref:Zn(2)-C6 fungal-type domain-containing protein n=1 Tax=Penicillium brasilianum TaxID=104259 RepID=A0A0F7TWS4_PENBI|nr:hypothetical protein PMG11_09656 [Penicillium brasilianum]
MGSRRTLETIACSRCQFKKVRCDRVGPECGRCTSIGADCIYRSRKPRAKKQGNDVSENNVLADVLDRLKRLEEHCGLETASDNDEHVDRSMSRPSVNSDHSTAVFPERSNSPVPPGVIGGILSRIRDPQSRALLLSNVFSHLQGVESRFFENENCVRAIAVAMSKIEHLQDTPTNEPTASADMPKEIARKFLRNYYDCYQFEGFKIPLDKSFLLSIPDLLENPHVQLDYISQIIYYALGLQGIILDPGAHRDNGGKIKYLYRKCLELTNRWQDHIQNTPADLYGAILMVSMALESCNSELAWKMLGHALKIAKALGYFYVDGSPEDMDWQPSLAQISPADETEVDKNRKRFEFWHLLRTDCLFRLSFGKPTLIPPGSWKVNLPDPTIDGVDDESSRFIQIHFLASMRLALVVMKYLDWVDLEPDHNPASHDATVDSFLEEVQLIMSDWDPDELLRIARTQVDTWFCADMIFSSYKFLIILHQSKKCSQERHRLPHQTVDFSRKSIQMFQSLLGSSLHAYWGISLILLHQFIPFFILCFDIIGNPERSEIDTDLSLVTWIGDHVESIVEERVELRPVMITMKAMLTACQQVRSNRLDSAMTNTP